MKLIVLKNNVPLNEVLLESSGFDEKHEIYVGRSEDCHVQIDDPLISRHHFVLRNDGLNWSCEKLSQLGNVTVGGNLVSSLQTVREGDEIKFGLYSVLVSSLPKVQQEPIVDKNETEVQQEPEVLKEPTPIEALPEEVEAPEDSITESVEESFENALDDLNTEEMPSEADFSEEEASADFNDIVADVDFDSENRDEFGLSAIDNSDQESTKVFKAFVNYQLVLFGEHAPYDRFEIDEDEIFIGRDAKKCQIILNDPEVSSVHAVIKKHYNDVTLEDLNSSNGTILNAERINKASITTGDEFVIGGTSFTLEVRSDLLESESDRLMPVESGQIIETEEIEEEEVSLDESNLNFDSDAIEEKSLIKRIWKNPAHRKKTIYAVVALVMVWAIFYEEGTDTSPSTAVKAPEEKVDPNAKPKLVLSKELENRRNVAYELGVSFFEQNKYFEALREFQTVTEIDPDYKRIQTYFEQTKVGLKRLEELEAQRRAEEERIKNKKLIEELLVKARGAVKDRNVQVAESFFSQITEKDPENMEVQQLQLELEAWQKDEQRKALAIAAKEAARKKMVDALSPGKTYYLKKEWYRAILKLEEFLRPKGTDEDLVKEASDMLSDSRNQLSSELGPLLGRARSLKEGQDFKNAYDAFLEILRLEPTNTEALNEVDDIRSQLDTRSKRVYREAIIAESLSLFGDAKEKFQEVQQISPTDSDYYKKASEKLKNYLE